MGLLKRLVGEKTASRMSSGWRGRPESDLRAYAEARGLEFRDHSNQAGYLGAFTWHADTQWNVVRGVLPGGEPGVLLHDVKLLDPEVPGTFYGVKSTTAGGVKLTDFLPGSDLFTTRYEYFKCPHTTACIRIPEATGTLHGLFVARRSERYRSGDGNVWHRRQLDEFGIKGWAAVVRKDADRELADEVLAGPVRELLSHPREHGFTIEFMYGQLIVFQQYFLEKHSELDDFCALACRLARAIRRLCEPRLRPQRFDIVLPEPHWLGFVRSKIDERHILAPQGVWLERIAKIAGERGLAVENGLDFHRAFPRLPVPGEAVGGMRGDGYRLLHCIERSIVDISHLRDAFDEPGGAVGCDAVVLPAPGRPDTPDGVEGVRAPFGRYAISDEMLAAWTPRESWQPTGEHFDGLLENARAVIS